MIAKFVAVEIRKVLAVVRNQKKIERFEMALCLKCRRVNVSFIPVHE